MIRVTINNTLFECSTTEEAASLFRSLSKKSGTADASVTVERKVSEKRKPWDSFRHSKYSKSRKGITMNAWTKEEAKKIYDLIKAGVQTPTPLMKDRDLLSRHSAKAISLFYYKVKNFPKDVDSIRKDVSDYIGQLYSENRTTNPTSRRSLLDPIDTPFKVG